MSLFFFFCFQNTQGSAPPSKPNTGMSDGKIQNGIVNSHDSISRSSNNVFLWTWDASVVSTMSLSVSSVKCWNKRGWREKTISCKVENKNNGTFGVPTMSSLAKTSLKVSEFKKHSQYWMNKYYYGPCVSQNKNNLAALDSWRHVDDKTIEQTKPPPG